MVRQSIQLLRGQNNELVDAVLTTLCQKHLDDFATFWKARLQVSAEEDKFWDWELKNRVYISQVHYEGYAIECEEITQGLILLAIQGYRSWGDPSRRIVYVSSLSTAPWNRSSIQTPVKFKAIGTTLLKFAKFRSEELGYGGLVGLHALPRAEGFYRKLGMIDCGRDDDKEGMTYFEWFQPRPYSWEE